MTHTRKYKYANMHTPEEFVASASYLVAYAPSPVIKNFYSVQHDTFLLHRSVWLKAGCFVSKDEKSSTYPTLSPPLFFIKARAVQRVHMGSPASCRA